MVILCDDAFFNQTGLELAGVVGPELGLLSDWFTGSGVALICKDKKEERVDGGFARGRSDA